MASRRLFAVLQTIDIYSQFEITVVVLFSHFVGIGVVVAANPYHGMIQLKKKDYFKLSSA
jgi:hypothetical protein